MLWFVVGHSRLEFSGEDIIKCFDKLQKSGIELKNIKKLSGVYFADIKRTDIKRTYDICRDNCVKVRVCSGFGIATKLFIHKNRVVFFCALIVFVAMFFLRASFVRNIEISGNTYLTERQIMLVMNESGLESGDFIYALSPRKISLEMMRRCSHFSWVWIEIKGTTAYVDVREKKPKPDIYDKSYACNIVAEKDGVISGAISESGINYTSPGKYVRKGDLLIGGVYDSNEYAPVRFVRAKGSVRARTKYTLSDNYSGVYNHYTADEKIKSVSRLKIFGFSIGQKSLRGENSFLVKQNVENPKIFGKKISSLGFTNEQYCEIIKTEYKPDKENVQKRAVNELLQRLKVSLPDDAEPVNEESSVTENSDGSFFVTVSVECIEDIGVESVIEISD